MFKREWPEAGDLVIGTVKKITGYGAYISLDEYGKEGLLHISEVASGWVRNIRSFMHEGQKLVLKVLRVDPEKGHIDLSLRRVTKREKREKILFWKRERRAESLLKSISEKLGAPVEEIYEKVGVVMEEKFGGIYGGLEQAAREGISALLDLGIPEDIAAVVAEVAKEKIKIPMVTIKGTLELRCLKPNGVTFIREALSKAQEVERSLATRIRVYVISPPRYCIEISARDYKEAEKVLQRATETAIRYIQEVGGSGAFRREK